MGVKNLIGPHEGRELSLMLQGQKKAALFYDLLEQGRDIPEEIIPEAAFAPHVSSGKILRFAQDIKVKKTGDIIRYVCFILPNEEGRMNMIFQINREVLEDKRANTDQDDQIIGRLLGYTDEEISAFLLRRKKILS